MLSIPNARSARPNRVSASRPANVGTSDRGATESPPGRKPKPLDQLRQALRSRHTSRRSEQTYCRWAKRFIVFHHGCEFTSHVQQGERTEDIAAGLR